jgi:hypothetical protein
VKREAFFIEVTHNPLRMLPFAPLTIRCNSSQIE